MREAVTGLASSILLVLFSPTTTLTIYSAHAGINGQSKVEGRPGYARMWIRDRGRRYIAKSAQHMIQDL